MRGRARERRRGAWSCCAKWEVGGAAIGEVTDTGRMRVLRAAASSSATCRSSALVDDCPLYDLRAAAGRPSRSTRRRRPRSAVTERRRRGRRCSRCSPRRTSPPAGRCSSSTTRSSSRAPCAGPSRPTRRCSRCPDGGALGVEHRRQRPPRRRRPLPGTVEAVLECAANLACVGAEPLGTTNNLNFGNPEKPHIAWQLTESVRGLGDACRALDAPIVGGNVSLYNEGADRPDLPDAGDRHGRPAARRAPRRPPRLRARRATQIALVGHVPPVARRLRAGQAARRAAPRRAARDRHRRGRRRAGGRARGGPRGRARPAPTTSPRAGWPSRWPSAAWPVASAPVELGEDFWRRPRPCARQVPTATPSCAAALFGEGPGRLRRQRRRGRAATSSASARPRRDASAGSAATRFTIRGRRARAWSRASARCAHAHDGLARCFPELRRPQPRLRGDCNAHCRREGVSGANRRARD